MYYLCIEAGERIYTLLGEYTYTFGKNETFFSI